MGYVPGANMGGKRTRYLTQPVDFMPTILDLAKVKGPKGLHGYNLGLMLRGKKATSRRSVAVTSATLPTRETNCVCSSITDGTWTLHYRGKDWPAELYNLKTDLAQKKNVYNRRNKKVAERLHRAYLKVLRDAGTPDEKYALRTELP